MLNKLAAVVVIFAGAGLAQYSTPGNRFASAGIGGSPEVGALFEVRAAAAAALTSPNPAYTPVSIFVSKDGYANNQINIMATDWSTNPANGTNIYAGSDGTLNVDVCQGTLCAVPQNISFDPAGGVIAWNYGGATGSTLKHLWNLGGTGVSTTNTILFEAIVDPDGGGETTSEVEVFFTAVVDGTSHQGGAAENYAVAGRDGVAHGGYRAGVNAIYGSDGTTFTSNGYTLWDYTNSENIFIASTIRAHSFQLGDSISLIMPHVASLSGTRYLCIGTDGTVTSSATACSGT